MLHSHQEDSNINITTPELSSCGAHIFRGFINILTEAVAVCGIATNVVNIVVFYHQGFQDNIQLSLAALATSDLLTCVSMAIYSWTIMNAEFCFFLEFPPEVWRWSNELAFALSLNSSFIAVFIAVERCLCTTVPFKVKQILTARRSLLVLISLGVLTVALVSPSFVHSQDSLEMKIDVNRNATITLNDSSVQGRFIAFMVLITIQSITLSVLMASTFLLVVTLKQKAAWRMENASTHSQFSKKLPHHRGRNAHKMVLVVCSIFLACFTPGQLFVFIGMIEHELRLGGRYEFLFMVGMALTYFLYSVNSSVNLVIYYKMSSKYRNTLNRLLGFGTE